ncbi:MAG: tyrosine--tRNA ligase [Candidatus Paceibacterota bacterium]
MKIAQELRERGFVNQCSTETLEEIVDQGLRTIYLGIDPTADAIHVGHLVPYMLLNHLLKHGHSVILLIGGGTALIGDPSGKDTERKFVDEEVVREQSKKIESLIRSITVSDDVTFLNNYDWLSKLSMIDFLRDVGKYFTVGAMVKKDSVATRLTSEQGISYTEFSYALLQSYDYYHLYKEHGCDLQIGASDQWGNITSGIDFIRRKTGAKVFGLTMPLLINPATGKKFGKTEGNAIWLNPEKTSPYVFYQFWFNTPDDAVIAYLKLFTMLSLEEIENIKTEFVQNKGERTAQKRLADEVTAFVHGTEIIESVQKVSEFLFGERKIEELNDDEYEIVRKNAPYSEVYLGDFLVDVLITSGLATSKREARTFITEGAITVGSEKITNTETVIDKELFAEKMLLLKRGKKQVCVLELL